MAIKRSVVITCDGPCGTVVNAETVPKGWKYLKIQEVHTPSGQKPHYEVASLCEKCTARVRTIAKYAGFAFSEVNAPEVPTLQAEQAVAGSAVHAEVVEEKI